MNVNCYIWFTFQHKRQIQTFVTAIQLVATVENIHRSNLITSIELLDNHPVPIDVGMKSPYIF